MPVTGEVLQDQRTTGAKSLRVSKWILELPSVYNLKEPVKLKYLISCIFCSPKRVQNKNWKPSPVVSKVKCSFTSDELNNSCFFSGGIRD